MRPTRAKIKKRLRCRLTHAMKQRGLPVPRGLNLDKVVSHLMYNIPRRWQEYDIDHIVPLRLFDFTDEGQTRAAFSPENHQWADPSVNRSKQAHVETRAFVELLTKYAV